MKLTSYHPIGKLSVVEMHTEEGEREIIGIADNQSEALALAEHDYERRTPGEDTCPHHYEVQSRGAFGRFVHAATIDLSSREDAEPEEPRYYALLGEDENHMMLPDGSVIWQIDGMGVGFRYGLPTVHCDEGAQVPVQGADDDSGVTNYTRASRALAVLTHYCALASAEELETTTVKDLLVDLAHLMDRQPRLGLMLYTMHEARETYEHETESGTQWQGRAEA